MPEQTPIIAYVLAGIIAMVLLGGGALLLAGNLIRGAERANLAWQVIDAQGHARTAPAFDDAQAYSEGLAAVMVDGVWGYVDEQGGVVVPPRFSDAQPFQEGLAAAQDPESRSWGVIDRGGAWVVPPSLDRVGQFSGGVAVATRRVGLSTSTIGGAMPMVAAGLLRSDGTWRVEPAAKNAPDRWRSARGPSDGHVLVELEDGWAIFDVDGVVRSDRRFEEAYASQEGLIAVRVGSEWGFVDLSGEQVISPSYRWTDGFGEGLAPVGLPDGQTGYIDPKGQVVLKGDYVDAKPFSEGLAAVNTPDGWTCIDKNGVPIGPERWQKIAPPGFVDKRAAVRSPDGWFLVDATGAKLAGPFRDATAVSGDVALVRVPRPS